MVTVSGSVGLCSGVEGVRLGVVVHCVECRMYLCVRIPVYEFFVRREPHQCTAKDDLKIKRFKGIHSAARLTLTIHVEHDIFPGDWSSQRYSLHGFF